MKKIFNIKVRSLSITILLKIQYLFYWEWDIIALWTIFHIFNKHLHYFY